MPVLALFECTAEENKLVSTPNIPDSYFNPSKAGDLRTQRIPTLVTSTKEVTYVFTIPPVLESQRNCSGSVTAFEYCFEAKKRDVNKKKKLFHFLSLTRETGHFRVHNKFLVEIKPKDDSVCTSDLSGGVMHICCGQHTLDPSNGVMIPSESYSFGIVVRDLRLLAFRSSEMEFNFPQFQLSLGKEGPSVGATFGIGALLMDRSLLLLKFIIGREVLAID